MKPLSENNLLKKYREAGISEEESKLLHKYFLCFSHLYGCMKMDELWDIFKQYDEKIRREKFYDFADIVQREENDYHVFNLNEVFNGETSTRTKDKLLINRYLVKRYERKFTLVLRLNDCTDYSRGPYIPSKEELFKYDNDAFCDSEDYKKMYDFVSKLKTTGICSNKYNSKTDSLLDLKGKSVVGKCLGDVIGYDHWEKFEIDYHKREKEKEYLRNEFKTSYAEKAMDKIRCSILVEDPHGVDRSISDIVEYMIYDLGVDLKQQDANTFVNLYAQLFNSSCHWSMLGHSPNEIRSKMPKTEGPIELRIGPNMQKLAAEGEIDLKDMENKIKESGMDIRIRKDDVSIEELEEENTKYLEMFEEFLRKRNCRESVAEEHVSRVDAYINHYLMIGVPKHAIEGCSSEILGFIENFVNEKVIPPSVHNIDFFLGSIRLFYECLCENKDISKKILKEFESDIKFSRDEFVEDYYDKNPEIIDLVDVIDGMEMAHGFGYGYLNVKTGEKIFIPEDEGLIDEDVDELYDKVEGMNWEGLPEIDDYQIMNDFALSLDDQKKTEKLLEILHNKKAYRNFKEAIHEMEIVDQYYDYYDERVEAIASDWCEEKIGILDECEDCFEEETATEA